MSTAALSTRHAGELIAPGTLPADRHPALTYLARLAPGSRRTMRQALDTVAATVTAGACDALTLDWPALRYQHVAAVRSRLVERYAPRTARKMLAAVRGVLRECWRLGLVPAEDYQRAVDLEPVTGSSAPRGRHLEAGELVALVEACKADPSPLGARDCALLAVLASGGLRRAEAAALALEDFEPEAKRLVVRRGKGSKARAVPIRNGAVLALTAWLTVRGPEAGPLFYRVLRGGHLKPAGLTPDAILKALARRAAAARVRAFSPHDLRRTFAGALWDAGAAPAVVRDLMGHADLSTTAGYDRRGERAMAEAAGLLHFPY